jgi:hypothetical protein
MGRPALIEYRTSISPRPPSKTSRRIAVADN